MDFKESDLYSPVCNYFTELGYDVQAEVKSCDLIAKKDSEIIIAELKKISVLSWFIRQSSVNQ